MEDLITIYGIAILITFCMVFWRLFDLSVCVRDIAKIISDNMDKCPCCGEADGHTGWCQNNDKSACADDCPSFLGGNCKEPDGIE